MDNVTQKQLKVIGYIKNNLGLVFRGTTKEEARDFISKYIDKSYSASNSYSSQICNHGKQTVYANRRELVNTLFPNNNHYFDEDDDWARPY